MYFLHRRKHFYYDYYILLKQENAKQQKTREVCATFTLLSNIRMPLKLVLISVSNISCSIITLLLGIVDYVGLLVGLLVATIITKWTYIASDMLGNVPTRSWYTASVVGNIYHNWFLFWFA